MVSAEEAQAQVEVGEMKNFKTALILVFTLLANSPSSDFKRH
jgi:hypothetical protein